MLLARFKLWSMVAVMAATALAAGAGPALAQQALAQQLTPFGPSNVRYDLELFKQPDLSLYNDKRPSKEGFFFQYERLQWAIQQPSRTEIGVPGGTAVGLLNGTVVFDPLNQPVGEILEAYDNSLDTGFLRADQTWGNRFELGFMEEDKGWFVSIMNLQDQDQSYFQGNLDPLIPPVFSAGVTIVFRDPANLLLGFVDTNADGFDDDLNITGPITPFNRVPGVFGRPLPFGIGTVPVNLDTDFDGVPDAFAGFADFGDQVPLVPLFDTIVVRNVTSMDGVEVNRSWRYPPSHRGGVWESFVGVRWLLFQDNFNVSATANLQIDQSIPYGLPGNSFWNNSIDNNMFGPQLGLRYIHTAARFNILAELRFLAALNFQSIHLDGELASALNPIPTNPPVDVGQNLPQNVPFEMVRTSFHQWQYDQTFAPVGEIRVGVNYQITHAIQLMAGYNAMIGGGISRASRRIDYVLPALQILDSNKNDAWFVNGLSLGINVNR